MRHNRTHTPSWQALCRVAVVAAVASVLASAPAQRPLDTGRAPAIAAAPDSAMAKVAARRQGSRVEAMDARTETRTVYAEPNGTFTAELTVQPIRVERNGGWVGVDTTLARRPDATIGPRAAAVDLALSPGGARDPLLRLGNGTGSISLSWPAALPAPELSGDTATYPEVLPGVDLVVTANVSGYAQQLVIKNAEAARNPALERIRFGLTTERVRLHATAEGGIEARDDAGTVVFVAPPSRMWDSSLVRREAIAGIELDDKSLTVVPDRTLLLAPDVTFPLVVDPDFRTVDKNGWTSVASGVDSPKWNRSQDGDFPWAAQVGQCYREVPDRCGGMGEAWTYFQFDTSFLGGTDFIKESSLDTVIVHSPNCNQLVEHQMFLAQWQIDSGTKWANKPPPAEPLLTRRGVENVNDRWGCGGWKPIGFALNGGIRRGGISTYILKATDPNAQLAWRKYDSNQTRLRVNFNRIPEPPTNLATQPALTPCDWCGGTPYVADDSITLRATLSDRDPGETVRPVWRVFRNWDEQVVAPSVGLPSGNAHTTSVSLVNDDRKLIKWYVRAVDVDNLGSSEVKFPQDFFVDRVGVNVEPTVSAALYKEDNRWHGGAGIADTFTFGSNNFKDNAGVNDIDHYLWGWNDPPTNKVKAKDGLGGPASVTLTPPGDGPRDLFVQMVDRAGHRSPTKQYHFYVRPGNGPVAQWRFDGNAEDSAYLGDRDGTLSGAATYGPGALGTSVHLDGQTSSRVTAPNTVHTDTAFSVSAWVKPDVLPTTGSMTVASQNGNSASGFYLDYRADTNTWGFMLFSTDSTNVYDFKATGGDAERATWTHLTGVFDPAQRKLGLYVNGVLVDEESLPAWFVPWDARGSLVIGGSQWAGQPVNPWHGWADEVQVHDRILTAAEIRAAVGHDNVQAGYWNFDETTGTTARNASDGSDLVLRNGASFTGESGGAVRGGLRLDGVDDYAVTSGPVVRTDQSFTVAAWTEVDRLAASGTALTVLSQEGNVDSGFYLQQRGTSWLFGMTGGDGATPFTFPTLATSPADTAAAHTPTHLAAVYDAPNHTAYLYVNGIEVGRDTTAGPAWRATGPFTVGRAKAANAIVDHVPGWVDEVRAYGRELSAEEIRGLVSRSSPTTGTWQLDGDANDANNRLNGTLNGSPDWTAGQTITPDPKDFAVRLNGTSAHVSAGQAVDVRRSFSVSAWAKLDRIGGVATVVSQDGAQLSSFKLRARTDGHWSLVMFSADSPSATWSEVVGTLAQVGVWTHLVVNYEAVNRRAVLYVNGIEAGSAPHTQVGTWPGTGGFQIGRAQSSGQPREYFAGAIDDVNVYPRTLFADEIRALAGRDLSLVHNWTLDEPTGTNAADAVGARAGTLSGGAAHVAGHAGNALSLDGVDDVVSTTGVDVDTSTSFTVTAWVRLQRVCEPSGFACRFTAVSLDGAALSKFRLGHVVDDDQHPTGAWIFAMPESTGTPLRATISTLDHELNQWVHLVGVYDAKAHQIWLYVNGLRQNVATLNAPWAPAGTLRLGSGRVNNAPAEFWPGQVDDVRVYTGALDKHRIESLYASYPSGGGTTPTLPAADAGRWAFDDRPGSTTIADSSGQGRHAQVAGSVTLGGTNATFGASGYAQTAGPVVDTTRSFSVSAWVAMPSRSTVTHTLVAQDGAHTSTFRIQYRPEYERWAVVVPSADTVNPGFSPLLTSGQTAYGDWVHLVVVYDVNLRQLRLYVNGRLSAAQVGVTVPPSTGPFTIGRGKWGDQNGDYLGGGVDDVRAFGRALDDGEVRAVHDDMPAVNFYHYPFDDDTARDVGVGNNGTLSGGTSFTTGVVGRALQLDGRSGSATTRWSGVSMYDSFTVSAWVRLSAKDHDSVALAQDGTHVSGFVLGYKQSLDRWVFGMPSQDAGAAPMEFAYAAEPAATNQWLELHGVYDHPAHQLRLYVNGVLAGTRTNVTAPIVTGPLTIGRGKASGQPTDFFAGAIDHVIIAKWARPNGRQ